MFVPGEEIYALFAVFVALTLMLISAVSTTRSVEGAGIGMRMDSLADSFADSLVKRCVLQDGGFDLGRLGNMTLENGNRVEVAGRDYGGIPPGNVSIYVSKRLVFVDGEPTVLVVRMW